MNCSSLPHFRAPNFLLSRSHFCNPASARPSSRIAFLGGGGTFPKVNSNATITLCRMFCFDLTHLAVFADNKLMDETEANIRIFNLKLKRHLICIPQLLPLGRLNFNEDRLHAASEMLHLISRLHRRASDMNKRLSVCLSVRQGFILCMPLSMYVFLCVCLQQPRRPITYPDAPQLRAALLWTADRASLSSVRISGRHPAIWLR